MLPGLRDASLVKAEAKTIKGIMPRKAWEGAPGRERLRGVGVRANHLTTAPRQRGRVLGRSLTRSARMGTGTPAWVGVRSQRQHPLPPQPDFPRLSLGGHGRKEVQYAPPRSAPPPPLSSRPPRGRVSSRGPRSSPERFKGPSGPAPGGPRPAAPPAGTWSPCSPSPRCRRPARDYNSRAPAAMSRGKCGRCPKSRRPGRPGLWPGPL